VLVNFAMTDFASQGKTRPYNVSDLNNLTTHQGYYTALSRSATAAGTLILQGFDTKKITGGCSGALRQEFRELELLDEITCILYNGKLPPTVYGDTRNTMIRSFREWKGVQYVPKAVHSALRWSKRDPLNESQIHDVNIKDSKYTTVSSAKPKLMIVNQTRKRRRSDAFGAKVSALSTSKKRHIGGAPDPGLEETHYPVPVGMKWSQNSCAYDSIFSILFSIWCNDKRAWNVSFTSLGNRFLVLLVDHFVKYDRKEIGLEHARDVVRRELAEFSSNLAFGSYTSLERVFDAIFSTDQAVYTTNFSCASSHTHRYSQNHIVCFNNVHNEAGSTAQWMQLNAEEGTNLCQTCSQPVTIQKTFNNLPPLIALEFSGADMTIDDVVRIKYNEDACTYRLAGVVYYRQTEQHFVSKIITRDNQTWFYDGLALGSEMLYSSSLTNPALSDHMLCATMALTSSQ